VFILQLIGCKRWQIFDHRKTLPAAHQYVPIERVGEPTQEFVLRAGDFLYLPRGVVHQAFTSNELSLHWTAGVHVVTWLDLVTTAIERLADRKAEWRSGLPVGTLGTPEAPTALRETLRTLLSQSVDDVDVGEACDQLAQSFFSNMSVLPADILASAMNARAIDLETMVEHRSGAVCHVSVSEKEARLQFPGNGISGPPAFASLFRFVAQTPRFAVGSLPDVLKAADKISFAQRLVHEGLLRIPV
jgi:hypothetical protein